jgi:hypothetical protein
MPIPDGRQVVAPGSTVTTVGEATSFTARISRAFQVTRIKVECSRDERFVQDEQSESNEVFDRAEATQRLPRSCRLWGCRMVSHAAHNAGLPVF